MRKLSAIVFAFFPVLLAGCGELRVADTQATRDGDDVVLAVTVSSDDTAFEDYCVSVAWKDEVGNEIERHGQCDESLARHSLDTFHFRLVGKTCATFDVQTRFDAEITTGACPR